MTDWPIAVTISIFLGLASDLSTLIDKGISENESPKYSAEQSCNPRVASVPIQSDFPLPAICKRASQASSPSSGNK